MSMSQEQINVDLFDSVKLLQNEVSQLESWKDSASFLLGKWNDVWKTLGKPGTLGGCKIDSTLEAVNKLLDAVRNLREQKGRHNTGVAYDQLMKLYDELKPQ